MYIVSVVTGPDSWNQEAKIVNFELYCQWTNLSNNNVAAWVFLRAILTQNFWDVLKAYISKLFASDGIIVDI